MTPEDVARLSAIYDEAVTWRGEVEEHTITDLLLTRISDLIEEHKPADELVWVARTLADVRAGDTVRLPTAPDLPARVLFAMPLDWHVRSGGDGPKAHWNDTSLEHRVINVRLDFKDGPRDSEGQPILREMPADVPIEIQLSTEELRAIELLGWDSRVRSERADG